MCEKRVLYITRKNVNVSISQDKIKYKTRVINFTSIYFSHFSIDILFIYRGTIERILTNEIKNGEISLVLKNF